MTRHFLHTNDVFCWLATAAVLAACGGGGAQTPASGSGTASTGTAHDAPMVDRVAEQGAVGDGDAGPADGGVPVEPAAPVVFRLVNTGSERLSFNMNKGWQPVIFAWSGERGKNAVPIIMFPKHCTASCDLPADQVCPYCPEPENNKQARELQKYEHVEVGQSLDVPWDGQVFVYEKTRGTTNGKRARCECWRKADPPPETYTVWACGIRLTDEANERSRPQCIERKMTLPPAETPLVVTFEFPDPAPKRRRR